MNPEENQPTPTPLTPEPVTEPVATPAPEVPPTPEPASAPETPTFGAVPAENLNLDGTPSEAPAPEVTPVPEAPTFETPAPEMSTPEQVTETPATLDPTPETPALDTESPAATSASFIGDAPEPKKDIPEPDEDAEPLTPADPVPGSIGSALAYSESAPNHAAPVIKPKKKFSLGLSKENTKTMLIIVAAVALVAAVVVVLIFIFGGSGSSNKKTTSTTTKTTPVYEPVVSSLTCTKEGGVDKFPNAGEVNYGQESLIAMYTDDELTSLGTTASLEYNDVGLATDGLTIARNSYESQLESLRLTSDPFDSIYDVNGRTVSISHQAEADAIDSTSGRLFGLFSLRGSVITDIESLQDSYEESGYECVAK